MARLGNIMQEIENGLVEIAENNFSELKDVVISDGVDFVLNIEEDVKSWTIMLALGNLTQDEFTSLVKGKKDLAEMTALKNVGLAKAQLDKLVNDILDMVISKSIRLIA